MTFNKIKPLIYFLIFLTLVLMSREIQMRFLVEKGITSYVTHSLISIGVNILIALVAIICIRRYQLQELAGIGSTKLLRPLLLIFPLYIVLLNIPDQSEISTENIYTNITVLVLYCISIGLSEELSLRGFLQSYVVKYFGNSRKSIIVSVIIVAFIFGIMHLIKFDKGVFGETAQVFYATFIGVMFGMLLLVTKRLAPLIIIHAIIDFVAKLDTMGIPKSVEGRDPTSAINALITVLIILPCFIYGMVISRKIKTGTVISIDTSKTS